MMTEAPAWIAFKFWMDVAESGILICFVPFIWWHLRRLRRDVDTILENHLPHIQESVSSLRTDVANLRGRMGLNGD